MQNLALMPRFLGALFYYSPATRTVRDLLAAFSSGDWETFYDWPEPQEIRALCADMQEPDDYAFSVLFEGQGKMEAPPWGSVYLDKDNLLMGNSAVSYRRFLQQHGLALASDINEPEDQFGLMLLALAALLEAENTAAAHILLEQYLLPWGYRYLDLLKANRVSAFYARLARLTEIFLRDMQEKARLKPSEPRLWF